MNHETVVGLFSEYLEERFSSREVQEVEDHVVDCELCIAGAELHRNIHMTIKNDPALVDDSPGPSLSRERRVIRCANVKRRLNSTPILPFPRKTRTGYWTFGKRSCHYLLTTGA